VLVIAPLTVNIQETSDGGRDAVILIVIVVIIIIVFIGLVSRIRRVALVVP
jgi:hypothetical protein